MWCTLKELRRINRWAQENTLRTLQRLAAQDVIPFQLRCNVSEKNHKQYEVYITEPMEIILLLKLRTRTMILKQSSMKQMNIVLPEKLAAPIYHPFLLKSVEEILTQENNRPDESYKKVQMKIPDTAIQHIHAFATKNRLTVVQATQIIFDEACARLENKNQDQPNNTKGEI
jgi:hypothetical protein